MQVKKISRNKFFTKLLVIFISSKQSVYYNFESDFQNNMNNQ